MKSAFVDVDTQIDFLYPAGALYGPGAERVLPFVRDLNRYAAAHGIPVISTTDAHAEDDAEFRTWPPHCVLGTAGQQKAAATLLDSRVVIANAAIELPAELPGQVIVEKQSLDVFSNPNFHALLERLGADGYVVYGVFTEHCVRHAAMGLLRTGQAVTLLTDAIAAIGKSEETLRDFQGAGGKLAPASSILY